VRDSGSATWGGLHHTGQLYLTGLWARVMAVWCSSTLCFAPHISVSSGSLHSIVHTRLHPGIRFHLEVYIAEAIDQVMHIRALENGITNNNPLVLAEIAEARRTYVEEKAVFDEIMDSDKRQIDLRKRQIAVLKHTLLLALYGIHAPIFITT